MSVFYSYPNGRNRWLKKLIPYILLFAILINVGPEIIGSHIYPQFMPHAQTITNYMNVAFALFILLLILVITLRSLFRRKDAKN